MWAFSSSLFWLKIRNSRTALPGHLPHIVSCTWQFSSRAMSHALVGQRENTEQVRKHPGRWRQKPISASQCRIPLKSGQPAISPVAGLRNKNNKLTSARIRLRAISQKASMNLPIVTQLLGRWIILRLFLLHFRTCYKHHRQRWKNTNYIYHKVGLIPASHTHPDPDCNCFCQTATHEERLVWF